MALPAVLGAGLAGAIVAGLASGAVQIVLKVLFGLGFGYLTFAGIDTLVTMNKDQIMTLLNGFSPLARDLIGVLKIGTCVNIMASAMVMRLTIFGLDQGVIRRMQVVTPGVGN